MAWRFVSSTCWRAARRVIRVTFLIQSPLWRSEPEDAPCGGSGFEPIAWEHAVEEIRLAEDSTVELAEEPDQVEEGLNKQMMERRQATEQAADPIAALLRMGILQRLRYLLEVERTPQAEVFTHELLEAFTRHSKAAANAVAKCPASCFNCDRASEGFVWRWEPWLSHGASNCRHRACGLRATIDFTN